MAGFLDKVVVGLNKGVNSVSEGYEFIVERANLNSKIKEVETEKARLLQNMGTVVYNLHASGEIEVGQCAGMIAEIAETDKQLFELQQQLQTLEETKKQSSQAGQYAKTFTTQQAAEGGVVCACGYVNKGNSKFCAKCGKQI